MRDRSTILAAALVVALCLLPAAASAQLYAAEHGGGNIYSFVDSVHSVNPDGQIPPSNVTLEFCSEHGGSFFVVSQDYSHWVPYLFRVDPESQTIAFVDSLDDSQHLPTAVCRGESNDIYIAVGVTPSRSGDASRSAKPYIARMPGGEPPLEVIRHFPSQANAIQDIKMWEEGDRAGHVATLERKPGELPTWDIGEYVMGAGDTLEFLGYRFAQWPPGLPFPCSSYTMNSLAVLPSGYVLLASDDGIYSVAPQGSYGSFGYENGAGDLEVARNGVVFALAGQDSAVIRRYTSAGVRIYPDIVAPDGLADLAMGDYVPTPEGEDVVVVPAYNVEITFEEVNESGLTGAVAETSDSWISPGGNILPPYAARPAKYESFTYINIGTDAVYSGLIKTDVLLPGERLFFADGLQDTFRDFTIVGSAEDARGTIPRFSELTSTTKSRPGSGPTEVVLVHDRRTNAEVTAYKFWRLNLAMNLLESAGPCAEEAQAELMTYVVEARDQYDGYEYGKALTWLAQMNQEIRTMAGWCIPNSSDAPEGDLVGILLAHSKTLMHSIELEWGHLYTGEGEHSTSIALAITTPAPGVCRMALSGPAGARARVSIFDVTGRLVATAYDGPLTEEPTSIVWNGTDESGRRVASGVYFARAEADGQFTASKFVLVR